MGEGRGECATQILMYECAYLSSRLPIPPGNSRPREVAALRLPVPGEAGVFPTNPSILAHHHAKAVPRQLSGSTVPCLPRHVSVSTRRGISLQEGKSPLRGAATLEMSVLQSNFVDFLVFD